MLSYLFYFPGYDHIVPLVAFIGAMVAALMVYALAWKNGVRPSRIILAGVAVAAFLGSGISALLVFYGDRVQGALLWMVGWLRCTQLATSRGSVPIRVSRSYFCLFRC